MIRYTYNILPKISIVDGIYHIPFNVEEKQGKETDPDTGEEYTYTYWMASVAKSASLDFGKVVSAMIREEYSLDDEIALSRQRDEKPEEWETYFTFVEDCKVEARKILYDEEYTPVEMSATTKDYLNSLNKLGL